MGCTAVAAVYGCIFEKMKKLSRTDTPTDGCVLCVPPAYINPIP